LAAACDAAHAVADVGTAELAVELHAALDAHRDETVFFGAAFSGVVVHAVAALEVRLGATDAAVEHGRAAVARYDEMGAVPWAARARCVLARALDMAGRLEEARSVRGDAERIADDIGLSLRHVAPEPALEPRSSDGSAWRLDRHGDGWVLLAGDEEAHLQQSRGLEALAMLLANPHREIDAVVLDGGDPGAVDHGVPVLDDRAVHAYRGRLAELDALLDRADTAGDSDGAERLVIERDAVVAELRRAMGMGGRVRTQSDDRERARINVTRNLKRAVERISRTAPLAAAHLTRCVRTGSACRYDPGDEGPDQWHVST
jgi:hypothetical protein